MAAVMFYVSVVYHAKIHSFKGHSSLQSPANSTISCWTNERSERYSLLGQRKNVRLWLCVTLRALMNFNEVFHKTFLGESSLMGQIALTFSK